MISDKEVKYEDFLKNKDAFNYTKKDLIDLMKIHKIRMCPKYSKLTREQLLKELIFLGVFDNTKNEKEIKKQLPKEEGEKKKKEIDTEVFKLVSSKERKKEKEKRSKELIKILDKFFRKEKATYSKSEDITSKKDLENTYKELRKFFWNLEKKKYIYPTKKLEKLISYTEKKISGNFNKDDLSLFLKES